MDTEIDLTNASRDVLSAIIVQQQAVIAELQVMIVRLERRVAELEGQAKSGGRPRMPGLKSSSGRQPPATTAAGRATGNQQVTDLAYRIVAHRKDHETLRDGYNRACNVKPPASPPVAT